MWRQIIHQLWNQRHTNAWLWAELTLVTVILWYGIDLVYNYEGAAMQPKGYDTDCVFDLVLEKKPSEAVPVGNSYYPADEHFSYLYHLIEDYPGVEAVCAYDGSVPYVYGGRVSDYASHTDSTHSVFCHSRSVTFSYFQVFRLTPLAGHVDEAYWHSSEHPVPTLISVDLADSLFHVADYGDVVGKTMFNHAYLEGNISVDNYWVAGVVPRQKTDDYAAYIPFVYLPLDSYERWWQHVAIRVKPQYVAGFVERFRRDMQAVFDRGGFYLSRLRSYADMKAAYDVEQGTVRRLNMAYALEVFFGFNVFLCVLATFWYRTRRRCCEIALRMAMGCTRTRVMCTLLAEGLMLLLLSALPALAIAIHVQLADLTVHTLMEMSALRFIGCFMVALVLLALVIVLGIWYPARQAMRIQPAEALHDE